MNGCHRNVGGVHACHGRHRTAFDQVAGKLQYIGGEGKQRYPVKSIQPTLNCLSISGSCLVNDDFRDSNGEARPTSTPPLCSDLLTCSSYQVTTWPRREVTDDGRLDVDESCHALILLGTRDSLPCREGASAGTGYDRDRIDPFGTACHVAVVDAYLRQNGRPTPTDMHAVEPSKLREVFGADAALYISIKQWGTTYQVINSSSRVVIECHLVDLQTGTILWAGTGAAVSDSCGGGGLVGALVGAVVNQVATSVHDPCPGLAGRANQQLFHNDRHGQLLGWRHPGFEADQVARRSAATPTQ